MLLQAMHTTILTLVFQKLKRGGVNDVRSLVLVTYNLRVLNYSTH